MIIKENFKSNPIRIYDVLKIDNPFKFHLNSAYDNIIESLPSLKIASRDLEIASHFIEKAGAIEIIESIRTRSLFINSELKWFSVLLERPESFKDLNSIEEKLKMMMDIV